MIRLIYPDNRQVPESTVRGWLSDAIANGEVTVEVDPCKEDIDHVCELLMNTGKFTFAHCRIK